MTLPVRKSKRKLEGEEEAAAKGTAESGEAGETVVVKVVDDSEEAKPPIIKKPRRDIAEAAAKAAAEEEKEKKSDATDGKEEAKEGTEKDSTAEKTTEESKAVPPAADAAAGQKETPLPPLGGVKQEDTSATSVARAPAPPQPIYKVEEYEEPDDGAEIPEDPEHVWNARLVDLLLYKHQYRTLHVQATYDQHLHSWVDTQRKLYRRHKNDPKSVSALTQLRLNALDAINFPFTLRGAAHWDRYFAKLQEFNKKHGHCLVPRLCEFAGLGDWVIDQRRQYKLMMQGKPSVLDPERQRKLEEMGFVWVVRNRPEWNNRYQELLQYREKYGDTKVPQHYKEIPGLGKWVAKQREQYRLLQQGKHSFLTPDRLEKLNESGFVWSVRKDGTEEMATLAAKKKPGVKKEDETKEAKEDGKPEEPKKVDGQDKVVAVEGKEKVKAEEKDESKAGSPDVVVRV